MSEELTVGTRIDHDKYGEGVVSKVGFTNFEVFFARGGKMEFSKSAGDFTVTERFEENAPAAGTSDMKLDDMERIITYVLDKYASLQEVVPMADKWTGGKLVITPGNPSMQSKEIPIDAFFHKIVMLRDRLRVLEQNINASEKLSDEDKVNLQQYITRIYGSLTTFNILFSEKKHLFVGAGGK